MDAARKRDVGRNDRDAVVHPGQGDERVRSRALQKHPGPDARDAARGVEPFSRAERAVEQEQRLVGQLGDVERATAAEGMLPRAPRVSSRFAPHFGGRLHNQLELGLLVGKRQRRAFAVAGKAALRRK